MLGIRGENRIGRLGRELQAGSYFELRDPPHWPVAEAGELLGLSLACRVKKLTVPGARRRKSKSPGMRHSRSTDHAAFGWPAARRACLGRFAQRLEKTIAFRRVGWHTAPRCHTQPVELPIVAALRGKKSCRTVPSPSAQMRPKLAAVEQLHQRYRRQANASLFGPRDSGSGFEDALVADPHQREVRMRVAG